MATPKRKRKNSNEGRDRSRSRVPLDQLEELEKEGRCRRIVCDVLTLRVMGYIVKQPASFMFIIALFAIVVCLPFIGLYIKRQKVLPDLDAMQNWNAYIGKLGQTPYCFQIEDTTTLLNKYPPFNTSRGMTLSSTGVMLDFDVLWSAVQPVPEAGNEKVLAGQFKGKEIGTQIKNDTWGKRIDDENIFIHFWLAISTTTTNCTGKDEESFCRVSGCVLITAPSKAVPARLPQVHEDFSFETQVVKCNGRCPNSSCHPSTFDIEQPVRMITLPSDCATNKPQLKVVNEHKFGPKGHGIIQINLKPEDQSVAAYHMYLAAVALAALSLAFTFCILLTDRPPDPKPSTE